MSTTVLHPVMLAAIEAERRSWARSGQLTGMIALLLAMLVLGLAIG